MTSNIHIKLEYPEAVQIKKDSLMCEQNLLQIVRYIRNYDALKKKEFAIKNKIKKDLSDLKNLIGSLEADLPREEVKSVGEKYKTTEIKKDLKKNIEEHKEKKVIEGNKMDSLEREIYEIKNKLARLE